MKQILLTTLLLFCVVEGIYVCASRVTVLGCTGTNFCIFSRNLTHLYNEFLICDIYKKSSSPYIPESLCFKQLDLLPYVQHAYKQTRLTCVIFTHLQKMVELVCKADPKVIS